MNTFTVPARLVLALGLAGALSAQAQMMCPARLAPGSVIPDPPMVRASNGVIGGTLVAHFDGDPTVGREGRYCLMYSGDPTKPPLEAPVFRLAPGERIGFSLVNRMPNTAPTAVHGWNPALNPPGSNTSPCSPQAVMQQFSANLHFHGTNVKPVCGSDEAITTLAAPQGAAWQYNFAIPDNVAPGLDWYHPHVHGIAQEQILGGMTGALVIDSPNQMPNVVGGLRERILVVRDQDPDPAPPGVRFIDRPDVIEALGVPRQQREILDANGLPASNALLNTLLAGGTVLTRSAEAPDTAALPSVVPPWKDLSVNKVQVKFAPSAGGIAGYTPPGVVRMEAASEFWRVANASADSYVRLQVRFTVNGTTTPQVLRVVAMDGIPVSAPTGQLLFDDNTPVAPGKVSTRPNKTVRVKEILLPPGGRAEFIVEAPPAGATGQLVSLFYETQADANPFRVLATLLPPVPGTVADASRILPMPTASAARRRFVDYGSSSPKARPDHLMYFSQNDTEFFITEDASTSTANPAPVETAFSMKAGPSVYVPNGAIQEWKIENRANEAHVFHMHQIRFRVLRRYPSPDNAADKLDEFTLRDTVDLPAWNGVGAPPSVTLRVFFNEPDIRGNFLYHCHILEHEDKGMMGVIRVVDPSAMPVARGPRSGGPVLALASAGAGKGKAIPTATAGGKTTTAARAPLLAPLEAPLAGAGPAGLSVARLAALSLVSTRSAGIPLLRDRAGNVIDAPVCSTPPSKSRRGRRLTGVL